MSQLIRIQTQLTSRDYLVRALEACGYEVKDRLPLRGLGEMALSGAEFYAVSGGGRTIGFRKGEGGYHAITGRDRRGLQSEISRVTQQYALLQVIDQAKKQGFAVTETTTQEDGTIQVLVRRWG